jgi:hypothetical protein
MMANRINPRVTSNLDYAQRQQLSLAAAVPAYMLLHQDTLRQAEVFCTTSQRREQGMLQQRLC